MNRKLALKIRNGTRSGKRLCDSCQYGRVVRGEAESEEFIFCHNLDQPVPFRVVECNSYVDKTQPQLHEMKAIAWVLRTDQSGKKIGFIDPARWRAERRKAGEYDDLLPDLDLD